MATSLGNFTSETQVGTGQTQLTTSLDNENRFIGKATFTNTSASPVTVTVWRILTASTPTTGSGGNWSTKFTVQAGKTHTANDLIGQVVGPLMELTATAGTGGVVNADVSGAVES